MNIVKINYLPLADAARRSEITEDLLIHLAATKQLDLYVKCGNPTISVSEPPPPRLPGQGFIFDKVSMAGQEFHFNGLLRLHGFDIRSFEAGVEYVVPRGFSGRRSFYPPTRASDPHSDGLDEHAPDDYWVSWDDIALRQPVFWKKDLFVLTADLDRLSSQGQKPGAQEALVGAAQLEAEEMSLPNLGGASGEESALKAVVTMSNIIDAFQIVQSKHKNQAWWDNRLRKSPDRFSIPNGAKAQEGGPGGRPPALWNLSQISLWLIQQHNGGKQGMPREAVEAVIRNNFPKHIAILQYLPK